MCLCTSLYCIIVLILSIVHISIEHFFFRYILLLYIYVYVFILGFQPFNRETWAEKLPCKLGMRF